MPKQREWRIVEREPLSESRTAGRRVSVLTIHSRANKHGLDPETVADRFDLDPADVRLALADYYENSKTMQDPEDERERAERAGNGPLSVE